MYIIQPLQPVPTLNDPTTQAFRVSISTARGRRSIKPQTYLVTVTNTTNKMRNYSDYLAWKARQPKAPLKPFVPGWVRIPTTKKHTT